MRLFINKTVANNMFLRTLRKHQLGENQESYLQGEAETKKKTLTEVFQKN